MANYKKFSNAPLAPMLFKMTVPATIAMLAQALYNTIDSIFVSGLSQNALSGMYIVTPIENVINAVAIGIGIGVNSSMSRSFGKDDHKSAVQYALNGIAIGVVLWLIFMVVCNVLGDDFVWCFTDNESIFYDGFTYIRIISNFCIFNILTQIGFSICQSSGNMVRPMIAQVVGCVLNCLIDPILIYGAGPIPSLGIKGAALSTVSSQCVSMLLTAYLIFGNLNNDKLIKADKIVIEKNKIWNILKVGIPASLTTIVGSVATSFINIIINPYSDSAIALYGIYYRLYSFTFLPIFGLIRAAMPILGYCYGAGDHRRYEQTLNRTCIISVCITTVWALIFFAFPEVLLGLFNPNEELLKIGPVCFRIMNASFLFVGISIPISNTFGAAGKSIYSFVLSFTRQILIILPVLWLLCRNFGLDVGWWAFPIADTLNLVLVYFIYAYFRKKYLKKLFKQNNS